MPRGTPYPLTSNPTPGPGKARPGAMPMKHPPGKGGAGALAKFLMSVMGKRG